MNPERQSGHTQNPVFPIRSVSSGLCCLWHAPGVGNALSTSVCPISCVAPTHLLGQSSPSTALDCKVTAKDESPCLACLGKHPSLESDGEGLPRSQPELDTAAMVIQREQHFLQLMTQSMCPLVSPINPLLLTAALNRPMTPIFLVHLFLDSGLAITIN